MRNKLIFGGALLSFLVLLAFANQAAHARPCDPTPPPLHYEVGGVEYIASWHNSTTPRIYFNMFPWGNTIDYRRALVIAEFDTRFNVWLFHGYVDAGFVKDIHRHWREHRRAYRHCMGYSADYYYKPYHSHYNYRWFQRQPRYRKYARPYNNYGHHHHPHIVKPHHYNNKVQPKIKPKSKPYKYKQPKYKHSGQVKQKRHHKPKPNHNKRRHNKRKHKRNNR